MAQLSMCIYQIMAWLGHKLLLDMPSVLLQVSGAVCKNTYRCDITYKQYIITCNKKDLLTTYMVEMVGLISLCP